eukprot:PhM_4_TR12425/c0_g1_i1/m.86835
MSNNNNNNATRVPESHDILMKIYTSCEQYSACLDPTAWPRVTASLLGTRTLPVLFSSRSLDLIVDETSSAGLIAVVRLYRYLVATSASVPLGPSVVPCEEELLFGVLPGLWRSREPCKLREEMLVLLKVMRLRHRAWFMANMWPQLPQHMTDEL